MENLNHSYNFAEKNDLKLHCKLEQKPNLQKLREQKQISKAEQRIINYLRLELPKLKIEQQVVFPSISAKGKRVRMLVDCLINDNLILQIDGKKWHSEPSAKIRDARQDFILSNLGFEVLRVVYDCPYPPKSHPALNQDWWAKYLNSVKLRVKTRLDLFDIFATN
jgi:very-short-patch-repair endonuclease